MKGLLLKELLMVRRQWFAFAFFIAIFSLMGILSGELSLMILMPMFMSIFLFNFLSSDEVSRWKQYSAALPYGRKTIVSSKYLSVLIFDAVSIIIISFCYMLSVCLKMAEFLADEFAVIIFLSVILGVIYPMLILPLYYRFNSEKSRMVLIIGGVLAGFSFAIFNDMQPNIDIEFISINAKIIMLIILAVVALLFTLSWLLSVKIYEKKDL